MEDKKKRTHEEGTVPESPGTEAGTASSGGKDSASSSSEGSREKAAAEGQSKQDRSEGESREPRSKGHRSKEGEEKEERDSGGNVEPWPMDNQMEERRHQVMQFMKDRPLLVLLITFGFGYILGKRRWMNR